MINSNESNFNLKKLLFTLCLTELQLLPIIVSKTKVLKKIILTSIITSFRGYQSIWWQQLVQAEDFQSYSCFAPRITKTSANSSVKSISYNKRSQFIPAYWYLLTRRDGFARSSASHELTQKRRQTAIGVLKIQVRMFTHFQHCSFKNNLFVCLFRQNSLKSPRGKNRIIDTIEWTRNKLQNKINKNINLRNISDLRNNLGKRVFFVQLC